MAIIRSSRESHEPSGETLRAGLCLLCLLACAFLWAAVWDFDLADWPSTKIAPHNALTQNACGRVGAWVAYHMFFYIGPGVYALLLCLSGLVAMWVLRGRVSLVWQRSLGVILLVCVTAAVAHLLGPSGPARLPIETGGILGVGLGRFLRDNFHWAGTALILLYCFLVGVLFAGDGLVTRLPALVRRAGGASGTAPTGARGSWVRRLASVLRARRSRRERSRTEPRINTSRVATTKDGKTQDTKAQGDDDGVFEDEEAENAPDGARSAGQATVNENRTAEPAGAGTVPLATAESDTTDSLAQETAIVARPYPAELDQWDFPPISLLDEPEYQYSLEQESKVRAQAKLLERTLEEYRVDASVVEIDTGPVITMFELQVGVGVKVSQIASLANDVARALKAPAVRVVAPIPGKNTVGIEVPNIDKEKVRLRELLMLSGKKHEDQTLPLYLGKDASGNPLVGDLAWMPHLLIAGTTGSGKSVCINSIIASILMTQRPDTVKLILVDPKMVELSGFREIPHLMCPIVTEISRAEAILDWAVTKMEERYELLAEAGVRNVAAFNRLTKEELYDRFNPASEEEKTFISTHIPHVIIVIDELADLMMTSAKEVEHCLARLAQKSRAVGIHIIVATQRPEARIVTGLIKSNMPCRIAFRVSSRMDSRIVLDQNGAEVLMGQGDMLFLPPGQSKLIRAQGTFVEEHELHKIIEFVRRRGKPDYHPELVRLQRPEQASATERDELFDEAVRIILESQRGSVSLLQRRLTVGYSRASRLIDQMADAGIVGEYKGSQAREVLITIEQWEAIKAGRDREEAREAEESERVELPFDRAEELEGESGQETEDVNEEEEMGEEEMGEKDESFDGADEGDDRDEGDAEAHDEGETRFVKRVGASTNPDGEP